MGVEVKSGGEGVFARWNMNNRIAAAKLRV